MLRILFTNICLWTRTGSELAVYDLTRGLKRTGQEPLVYSPRLGKLADDIRAEGVPVFSRLEEITAAPDLIHGNHFLETLEALRYFPDVPGIFVCHDRLAWHDEPPRHGRLQFYVAVDLNCRERLLEAPWLNPNQVTVIENSVDTNRFKPRTSLPSRPVRALVFSNNAGENTYLEAVNQACRSEGIQLDVVGAKAGNELRSPEEILPQYDLVFAKARCALEAMASGAAVILCDSRGLGPMVKRCEVEELRQWNFGMRLLTHPLEPADIVMRIREYNQEDATAVSAYIRDTAALEKSVARYSEIYSRLHKSEGRSLEKEQLVTQKLRCRDQALLRLKLTKTVTRARPGEEFFLPVRIRRLTFKPVATELPWPTLLSYRWFSEDGGTSVQQEGIRSLLLPPVPWGFSGKYDVRVVAPWHPGRYRLRITLIQEDWRWLDEKPPEVFAETRITIEPGIRAFYSRG